MSFRYKGLPLDPFRPLFGVDEAELGARGIRRVVADEKPGFPCRVTLEDAEPGERLLLVSFPHQPAHSPYKAAGPVFVREQAQEVFDKVGVVPPVLRSRLLSVRAYDSERMMVDADVVDGKEVERLVAQFFENEAVESLHIHYARRGCFACSVERA